MDPKTILATDDTGTEITVSDVQSWIKAGEKDRLASLVYLRLYGRYIKPFDFRNDDYEKSYKNGFSIMANCCLLIESYISYKEPLMINTHGHSERCFGMFFVSDTRFSEFNDTTMAIADYRDMSVKMNKKNNGIPKEFYQNVRNGLLHAGETRNGWKITRQGKLFDEKSKRINAVKFMNRLKASISDFEKELRKADLSTSQLWKTYLNKLEKIIAES